MSPCSSVSAGRARSRSRSGMACGRDCWKRAFLPVRKLRSASRTAFIGDALPWPRRLLAGLQLGLFHVGLHFLSRHFVRSTFFSNSATTAHSFLHASRSSAGNLATASTFLAL